MADVSNELKNLSETLQNRNTTISKAHTLLITFTKQIEALSDFSGEQSILAQEAGKTMPFQEVELRKGRSSSINQAQFIKAVEDIMKQRLFSTVSNKAQPKVYATQKENCKTLVKQMDVLDPERLEHENPRLGEEEVKSLCETFCLSKQGTHLTYIEFKASGGRSIFDQVNKLLWWSLTSTHRVTTIVNEK